MSSFAAGATYTGAINAFECANQYSFFMKLSILC